MSNSAETKRLEAMLRARTDAAGKPKPGYRNSVASLKARLKAIGGGCVG